MTRERKLHDTCVKHYTRRKVSADIFFKGLRKVKTRPLKAYGKTEFEDL